VKRSLLLISLLLDFALPAAAQTTPFNGGNAALKTLSADNMRYVSTAGNDSNDGLSWRTAKLTPLAAVNVATSAGTAPGTVYLACGTYPGLPSANWYQLLTLISSCNMALGPLCGQAFCGPNNAYGSTASDVIFQYFGGLTIGPAKGTLQNIDLRGIVFDFKNSGGGLTLQSVVGFNWRDFAVYRCGNTTTDCLVLTTGKANLQSNSFTNFFINPNTTALQYANCLRLQGTGAVLSGQIVTNNVFINGLCAGQINNGLDFELNSDSNFFWGYRLFNALGSAVVNSSALVFNKTTPGSDQDAGNGSIVAGLNVGGLFSKTISMGQTTGAWISSQTGSSLAVNVLGGTPAYDIQTMPLTAGTKSQIQVVGTVASSRFLAITGTQLTTGQFSFGGNWGTGASFTSVTGTDGAFTLTFSSGSGSPGANPTIQLNFADGSWTNPPVCNVTRADGSSPVTAYWAPTLPGSATFLTLNFLGTPAANTSYAVVVTCSGKPN
jgi:hypothetical protein